jgi:hypothetical protein
MSSPASTHPVPARGPRPGSAGPPAEPARPAGHVALAVGAGGALLLLLADLLVADQPEPTGDQAIYQAMADSPVEPAHTFPFAYRLLVPTLVHVLPLEHTLSFQLIAWIASGAAAGVLFLLLERLGSSRRVSVPLAVLLPLSPPLLLAALRQGRVPDPVTALVMCAGALFIVQRRPRALAATMVAGALNHEAALWLAPWAYAIWARRLVDARAARDAFLAGAPALALWISLRLAVPAVGREQVPGYGSPFGGRIEVIRTGLGDAWALGRRLVAAYGPLWLLLPPAVRSFGFARRSLVLVPLVLVGMTFGLDWQRFAFFVAPAVYAAAAWTLDRHPRLLVPTLAAWLAVIVGYAVYMHVEGVQSGLIDVGPPPYPVR